MKGEADVAIKAEGISTHGKKLARWKDLTQTKYATEDDSIRAEVQEKHQEALTNWKEKCELARASVVQDLGQEEKIRAFNELRAHLDCIFCHLSYKTGGLKFSCIAGGQNPATGDIVILDYHLGETEMGDEFLAEYAGFSKVQAAYANFIKLALAHDDKMLVAPTLDAGTTADEVANNPDNIFEEGSKDEEEENSAEEEGNVKENEELGVMDDIGLGLDSLFKFD
ncbi:uncharacterized protein BJ212DRAFT_1475762 [Suillus subaureus]|uniref:Uncharacterized protein n=1 Tax=Suillus subaureus TaxID=48587 RepID=A0A9P7EL91_9AGAM|nr:uncharacterized protein BJ212DRAFT_1475762 [Suillus subaureus]KAG1824461.1 hypothetical protein BJ212DRAFT_1475762 [Suillus subaureus]